MAEAHLLEVRDLVCSVHDRGGRHAILANVNMQVGRGEVVGLAGGSGSGKTTLARAILRLIEVDGGSILFEGRDLACLRGAALRQIRPHLQMVFQDPMAAFNPRARVERVIGDPLRIWKPSSSARRREHVEELLDIVGLPGRLLQRYPHELSGGQRQRVAIARALATEPRLIVLDEPVSALDVSVRAQILNLLLDVRQRLGTALLFIAHDIAVMRIFCDRLCVMDGGRIVEEGPADSVVAAPQAEMTRSLIDSAPRLRV